MSILDWTLETATITTANGTAKYALASDTFKVLNVSVAVSGVAYPVDLVSVATFDAQPTATAATPTMAVFNPRVETIGAAIGPTLTFYPTPNATLTVTYRKIRKLADFDTALDTPDVPQSWFDALTYLLAANLIDEYGMPAEKHNRVMQKAVLYKQAALNAFNSGWRTGYNPSNPGPEMVTQ